jgi:hypothetical protein
MRRISGPFSFRTNRFPAPILGLSPNETFLSSVIDTRAVSRRLISPLAC